MPVARTIATRARKKEIAAPRIDVYCALSGSLQMARREQRQLTREILGRSADGYVTVPFQLDEWLVSNVTFLRKLHSRCEGVGGASVLLVGMKTVTEFSRRTDCERRAA